MRSGLACVKRAGAQNSPVNYLAHLYLSEPTEDAWLGALLGDFVKGPLDPAQHGIAITRAIAVHRRIDTFTDAHPVVLRSKARISAPRRRYAGIMLDMFYDHFLAKYWSEFHQESLEHFANRVYAILGYRHHALPPRLRHVARVMAQQDWLGSYARIESIRGALDRMSLRLRRENPLHGSADELVGRYGELEADFREFLPLAARFVQWSAEASASPVQTA